jgi:putative transposase
MQQMNEKRPRKPVHDDGWRLPDALWVEMEPLLPPRPPHPLGCHNPRVPDRAAMDAIFFVLRTGCPWNALNRTGMCSSSSAHRRFQEWAAAGVFEAFWGAGLLVDDALAGIDWSWLALDGAMGKAPRGGKKTGPNPTDRGKRGGKRALLTDGRGTPLSGVVAGANIKDHKLRRQTLASLATARPQPTPEAPQNLCLDQGYDCAAPRALAQDFAFTLHLRTRGAERREKVRHADAKARRWIVERTHSWLNRFRRILIRWEKKPENYLAMLHFALAIITWRQAHLPG